MYKSSISGLVSSVSPIALWNDRGVSGGTHQFHWWGASALVLEPFDHDHSSAPGSFTTMATAKATYCLFDRGVNIQYVYFLYGFLFACIFLQSISMYSFICVFLYIFKIYWSVSRFVGHMNVYMYMFMYLSIFYVVWFVSCLLAWLLHCLLGWFVVCLLVCLFVCLFVGLIVCLLIYLKINRYIYIYL